MYLEPWGHTGTPADGLPLRLRSMLLGERESKVPVCPSQAHKTTAFLKRPGAHARGNLYHAKPLMCFTA